MSARYEDVIGSLRESYDTGAVERDGRPKDPWKIEERAAFLERLRAGETGTVRLLEIGAGPGTDSLFFHQQGLQVVASDLSPGMVAKCREKGLEAHVSGFLDLGRTFPAESFDAVYALNCLLHVPDADLPAVLETVRRLVRPGGLVFVGVYGGDGTEGVIENDSHTPPRFFSWRTDEQIQRFAGASFDIEDFHTRPAGDFRFQSLTLRRGRLS